MTKIDFCSDLHVDAWYEITRPKYELGVGPQSWQPPGYPDGKFQHIDWGWYKNPDSTILVIAGDTSNKIEITADVLIDASKHYEWVVTVSGNHEHYDTDRTMSRNNEYMAELLAPYSNIVMLDGTSKLIGSVLFVGALGWYDWAGYEGKGITIQQAYMAWQSQSNDSRYPRFAELKGPSHLALTDSFNMAEEVRKAQTDDAVEKIVCVTHTSPREELMFWHPTNHNWNLLTPSYMNSKMSSVLEQDVLDKIKFWIYGHTHERKMVDIDGITYANNACGYPRENSPWTLPQIEV